VLAVIAGCGHPATVERAYDGRIVWGRYVDEEAYATFLRGSIAEASGDAKGALAAYQEVAAGAAAGPEVWARIAALRCAIDPRDPKADDAVARALAIDAGYGAAWTAKANCALLRGDALTARVASERAAQQDDGAAGGGPFPSPAADSASGQRTRDLIMAMTVTAGDRAAAWEALAAWSKAHGDVPLWSRAVASLVRLLPTKRGEVAEAAHELAGAGEIGAARTVAAAAASAGLEPFDGERWPLAARLAVDEAIVAGDANTVRSRATRARVGLDEAAARAVLAGRLPLARELASPMAQADPSTNGARLVVAGVGGNAAGAAQETGPADPPVAGAVLVAFGEALARQSSPERARLLLGRINKAPIVAGDDVVARPAVALAARGVLDAQMLSAEGRVELDVLRGEAPSVASNGDARPLDLRHEYLALAASRPTEPRARELGQRLARVASRDPVVAAASALWRLANEPTIAPGAADALMAVRPADPLLAAVALRVAKKSGDSAAAQRAQQALGALLRE
jgi:hypothetical protein